MKVVLIKDVRDMGRAGSAVEVSDGHALNFLIPRKLAIAATATNLKQAEARAAKLVTMREVDAKLVEERLQVLSEGTITIVKKANEQGHLYDAVNAKDIADAAQLPEDAVRLEKPIKEVGVVEVPVAYGENFGKVSVTITAE